jgi:hypothetical protein
METNPGYSFSTGIYIEIKSDGHCLFRAIATQLELLGHEEQYDFVGLRELCREYIETNPEDFRAFIENGEGNYPNMLNFNHKLRGCVSATVHNCQNLIKTRMNIGFK